MLLGIVIGHATSTRKHPSFDGWRLLVVQPLNMTQQPETDPVIALDAHGAARGTTVVLSSDGKAARELVQDKKSPARFFVCGLVD